MWILGDVGSDILMVGNPHEITFMGKSFELFVAALIPPVSSIHLYAISRASNHLEPLKCMRNSPRPSP